MRRLHAYKRSLRSIIIEIGVPLALVVAGIGLSQVDILASSPQKALELDLFGQN